MRRGGGRGRWRSRLCSCGGGMISAERERGEGEGEERATATHLVAALETDDTDPTARRCPSANGNGESAPNPAVSRDSFGAVEGADEEEGKEGRRGKGGKTRPGNTRRPRADLRRSSGVVTDDQPFSPVKTPCFSLLRSDRSGGGRGTHYSRHRDIPRRARSSTPSPPPRTLAPGQWSASRRWGGDMMPLVCVCACVVCVCVERQPGRRAEIRAQRGRWVPRRSTGR